jgi:hypothetical protein
MYILAFAIVRARVPGLLEWTLYVFDAPFFLRNVRLSNAKAAFVARKWRWSDGLQFSVIFGDMCTLAGRCFTYTRCRRFWRLLRYVRN